MVLAAREATTISNPRGIVLAIVLDVTLNVWYLPVWLFSLGSFHHYRKEVGLFWDVSHTSIYA